MWKPYKRSLITLAAVLVCYVAASFFVTNSYYQIILASIPVWASLATSWNIFSGYSGLTSFGHAAFFAIGAYTVTILQVYLGVSPWIGLFVGAAIGALSGLLIGLITFRLKGHYFALAMLAYPLSLMYVAEWLGFQELSVPINRDSPLLFMQFSTPFGYTVLCAGLLFISATISLLIERSRIGLILQTVKQNEMAAEAAGINPRFWKTVALVVSGALAASAGGVYVSVLLVATAREVFGVFVSASAIVFTMFGGIGSIWGPLIGAAVLVPLAETLHAELGHIIPGLQGVVYGVAIILVAKLMPEGIYWRISDLLGLERRGMTASISAFRKAAGEMTKTMMSPGSLKVSRISKSFGKVAVAQDISMDIQAGSITGIVGPNGAGKTTFFNLLNGFVAPQSGEIVLNGTVVNTFTPGMRATGGLGRTFQVARVFERLSVFDNILAGAAAKTRDMAEARKMAFWAAHIAELDGMLDAPAGSVSAYHVRLIEIARAIAGRPRVLLLDETLAGLSHDEALDVANVVRNVRDAGITVVIIEHTMSVMVQLVDRMIVLDQGRLIADGPPAVVLKDKAVITAYLGSRWANRA